MIVYISIGNSDDKLGQREWFAFQLSVRAAIRAETARFIGEWFSAPDSSFQNACFCIEIGDKDTEELKTALTDVAKKYRQDSIAWAEVQKTTFLGEQTFTEYHPNADVWTVPDSDTVLNHPGSDRWTGGDKKTER